MLDPTILSYAFAAGLLATINPCGFAMLPAYVSYYLNDDSTVVAREHIGRMGVLVLRLRRALAVGATVSAGFVLLFGVAGALISAGASALADMMPLLGLLVGIGMALLGAWLVVGKHIRGFGVALPRFKYAKSVRSTFVFGLAYGLASLSCALPVFLVAVAGALVQEGFGAALAGFGAYVTGMALTLMGITVGLAVFQSALVAYMKRVLPYVPRISGLIMLGAGGYITHYWLKSGFLGGLSS